MPHLSLPAGTDVAEMALFDVDALPLSSAPNEPAIQALAESKHLIRLPTGADGEYLLYMFVDEPIPEDLLRFCITDDKLTGTFNTTRGNVAFGGLESTFSTFKPNPNIRSDANINPGEYSYTAFHTDFPKELVEEALRVEKTSGEYWLSRAPILLTRLTIAVGIMLSAFKQFLIVGVILLTGYIAIKWLCSTPAYQTLVARRAEANLQFPSIVIEMQPKRFP